MPFVKGQPKVPGSGRGKGTKDFKTLTAEHLVKKLGVDPLHILMLFAKGDWKKLGYKAESTICYNSAGIEYTKLTIQPETRVAAAKEAVKYLYSQKKAIEVSHSDNALNVNVYDYLGKKK
jgi:hypothetical protein